MCSLDLFKWQNTHHILTHIVKIYVPFPLLALHMLLVLPGRARTSYLSATVSSSWWWCGNNQTPWLKLCTLGWPLYHFICILPIINKCLAHAKAVICIFVQLALYLHHGCSCFLLCFTFLDTGSFTSLGFFSNLAAPTRLRSHPLHFWSDSYRVSRQTGDWNGW